MRRFLIAALASIVALLGLAGVASATEDPFVAVDTAAGGVQTNSAVSTVTSGAVTLIQDGRESAALGTSAETPNLGIESVAASELKVDYELSGGASFNANGVRLFAYSSPGADTWSEAPSIGTVGATSASGTLTLDIPAGVTIGTAGVVYDNPDEGTVVFTNLRFNGEAVSFTDPPIDLGPQPDPFDEVVESDWEVTTEPTCDAPGEETRTVTTQSFTHVLNEAGTEWVAVEDGDPSEETEAREVDQLSGEECEEEVEPEPGPEGPQGEQGEPGEKGEKGDKGDKGDPGEAVIVKTTAGDEIVPVSSAKTLPATGLETTGERVAMLVILAAILLGVGAISLFYGRRKSDNSG